MHPHVGHIAHTPVQLLKAAYRDVLAYNINPISRSSSDGDIVRSTTSSNEAAPTVTLDH